MRDGWRKARVDRVNPDGSGMVHVEGDPDQAWPKVGEPFLVRVRRSRSAKHHRLYWAMLKNVVDATDNWPTAEAVHKWLKYKLGLYTVIAVEKEKVVIEWDKTDFIAMSQDEFRRFFDKAVAALCIETGIDPVDFDREMAKDK